MKKFATIAGSIALLIGAVIPAMAAGNNCSNGTTGPLSHDYCYITNTSDVNVSNTNSLNLTNSVTAVSNTGHNSASYNTLGGNITTGNATLNATVNNVGNINTTTVTGGPSAANNSGSNNITGPSSDNRVTITNSQRVNVVNSNQADVRNTVDATADSGYNNGNYNTGPANVQTGSTVLGVNLQNHLNDSATGISAGAGGAGGNSVANDTTGPFSTDYVDVVNSANATVNNPNYLSLGNSVAVVSRSGNNGASYNTLGGNIGTGGSSAGVGMNNEGNISTTTIQMAMGGFANDGSNGVTGPLSDNRTTLLNSFGTSVSNPNNANVTNSDTDVADTGSNASNYNTGGGAVWAGLSDLWKTISNHLNDSLTVIQ
ncbi:hypothetical protein M1271_05160 [Patescibacteria group bacterium]|nr:hypothetical protein [Patescibacteria group bacterium]MCL5797920.1 hypothetical protein [Patescibacteria group bacterium]